MFPTTSYFPYGAPTYSSRGRPDASYYQALAEEEAARRQYAEALRAQEEARSRAARARFARQAYESSHNSYLPDDDEDGYDGYGMPVYGFDYPTNRRSMYGYPSSLEQQRLAALELERERERERERLRLIEEERARRRRMIEFEQERKRQRMLAEEERRMQLQREAEEQERRMLEQEMLRRQQQSREPAFMSPFEEFFGLRPSRMPQPMPQETPFARRARTMSSGSRARPSPPPAPPAPVERTASRSPTRERVPTPTPVVVNSVPTSSAPSPKPQAPQRITEEQIDAATKIQTHWRRHRALRSIAEQAAKFAELQKAFTLPSTLEYIAPGASIHSHEHISVPVSSISEVEGEEEDALVVPKLAYTPTNAPVHMYDEELSRILTKLDGIESGGDKLVRTQRREVVRNVEKEARRVERVKAATWKMWLKQKDQAATNDVAVENSAPDASVPEDIMAAAAEEPVVQNMSRSVTSSDLDVSATHAQPVTSAPEVHAVCQEPMVVDPTPNTAEAEAPTVGEGMVIDSIPESSHEEPQHPSTSAAVPSPSVIESSSQPLLSPSHSDAASDLPPTTPEEHTLPLESPVIVEKPQLPAAQALPNSDLYVKERLEMLRPLVEREWEDDWDLF